MGGMPSPESEQDQVLWVGFTGGVGARAALRVPFVVGGVAMPDWTLAKANVFQLGRAGVIGAGYFDSAWKPATDQSAWR